MKISTTILLALMFLNCNCAAVHSDILHQEAGLRRDMQASTVMLHIEVVYLNMASVPQASFLIPPLKTSTMSKACSGVVVDKTINMLNYKTLIVTATHCLDLPDVGDRLEDGARVISVTITAHDSNGLRCRAKTVKLGGDTYDDVATAVVNCNLGKKAIVASKVPDNQDQIHVSGHPEGIYPTIITLGFMSGYYEGYLLLSAAAHSGNSGGAVFNSSGEVVGILVRGSDEYEHITLAAPLDEIKARIKNSIGWDK
jgi:S1-C subfamily serine protease